MKQDIEITPDTKDGFLSWIKEHKTKLLVAGISISALIAIVLGLKNKDEIKKVWDSIQKELNKPNPYSNMWLENAPKEEIDIIREEIRVAYCSSGDDFEKAAELQRLLGRIDKELSRRAWGDITPSGPSVHREHGWYLPNDD